MTRLSVFVPRHKLAVPLFWSLVPEAAFGASSVATARRPTTIEKHIGRAVDPIPANVTRPITAPGEGGGHKPGGGAFGEQALPGHPSQVRRRLAGVQGAQSLQQWGRGAADQPAEVVGGLGRDTTSQVGVELDEECGGLLVEALCPECHGMLVG